MERVGREGSMKSGGAILDRARGLRARHNITVAAIATAISRDGARQVAQNISQLDPPRTAVAETALRKMCVICSEMDLTISRSQQVLAQSRRLIARLNAQLNRSQSGE